MKQLILLLLFVQLSHCQTSLTVADNILISYVNLGQQTMFTFSSPLGSGVTTANCWLAIGINSNPEMGNANVAMCIKRGTNQSVYTYYNQDTSTGLLDPNSPQLGISNISLNVSNGVLTCSVLRDNSNSIGGYFNITNDSSYYIIGAYGQVGSDGSPMFHPVYEVSDSEQSFAPTDGNSSSVATTTSGSSSSTVTTPSTTTRQSQEGQIVSGALVLTWKPRLNHTHFEFYTQSGGGSNRYISFAFSNDQLMGDDNVVSCVVPSAVSSAQVLHMYNSGKSTPSQLDNSDASVGIFGQNITYIDGKLSCSFNRYIKRSSVSNYFSLENTYYVLTASGSYSGGMQYHSYRASTSQKINFMSTGSFTADSSSNLAKIQVHGCLMVVAWLGFATTGIILARYYKFLLPKFKLGKNRLWFILHQSIMILVVVCNIVSLFVILAHLEFKWVDSSISQMTFVHSIFGIIAIALAVIQSCLSFLRPDPDHSKRFIFNYFHGLFGILTFLCAFISTWLGVFLPQLGLNEAGWALMLVWTVWIFVLPIAIEIFTFIVRMINKRENLDMNCDISPKKYMDRKEPKRKIILTFEIFKIAMIIIHLLVATGLTVGLIVVICRATGPTEE